MKEYILDNLENINIKFNEPLKEYLYTKVGGVADYLIFPENSSQIQKIIKTLNEKKIKWIVLGNASNVIIKDGGFRGAVIMMSHLTDIKVDGNVVEAQAGANLAKTTQIARDHSLTGFEFACGIPGSVGGAVFMNAGAYGGEVSDIIESIDVVTIDGELKTIPADKLNMSYRYCSIQDHGDIVVSARFKLKKGDKKVITAKMDELTELRESKQPLDLPSCGSVFKKPEGYFAAKLISDAGLKGYRIGGVEVSKKHSGFMVNIGNGTANDYEKLIEYVIGDIENKFGVKLETEVRIIGDSTTTK